MEHFGFSGKIYLDEKKSQINISGYKSSQTDIHIEIGANIYMIFFPKIL